MHLEYSSDIELLNLLFSFKDRKCHLPSTAAQLLQKAGSVHALLQASPQWWIQQPGIGARKAYRLAACLQLMRRAAQERLSCGKNIFTHPYLLKQYLLTMLQYESREVFIVILLNARHELMHAQQLFSGSISEVAVYPQEILRIALLHQSSSLAIAHNHPSGSCLPSDDDLLLTHTLGQACDLLGMKLLDHFLIACGNIFSFAEQGCLLTAQK